MLGKYSPYPAYKDSCGLLLGEVPAHWLLTRVKYIAELTPKKPVVDRNLDCSFIPMEKLKRDSIVLDETKQIDTVYDGYTYFAENDILMAKVTPCFENKNIAIAKGLKNQIGFGSSEIYTIRVGNKANSRYVFYRLQEDGFMDLAIGAMTGAGGLKRVPSETVANYTYATPEDDEQQKIANFLDHETAKIDTLIEKQQQLIKLLKEKRQAVISHAVTKGLNPNAPMRDSGVEWLGEVPDHWGICCIKHVISPEKNSMVDGPFGSSVNTDTDYVEEGTPVIRTVNITNDGFSSNNLKFMREQKFIQLKRHAVYPGDVLFSKVGTIGNSCVLPESTPEAILSTTGSCKITINVENFMAQFLVLCIRSMHEELMQVANSNVQPFLNMVSIKNLKLPLPSVAEQNKILERLNTDLKKLDKVISKATISAELLQERRTALISAAVTGKIDVRNWVAPEPSNTNNKEDAA
jgi:type I restriction enzyme, S subunit